MMGLEAGDEGLHEREVVRTAKFEDKCVAGSIGVPKIGLTRS